MPGPIVEIENQLENEDHPVIEDVEEEDDHSTHSDQDEDDKEDDALVGGEDKQSRSEKKSRKALLKLGMKAVIGVSKVTIKKTKTMMFTISKPDVYKSTNSETYVIFGEARIQDDGSQLAQAAQQFKMPDMSSLKLNSDTGAAAAAPANADEENEEEVDESGVKPDDVELVMAQAGVSRAKAIKALKEGDGDIVNAIMQLTN